MRKIQDYYFKKAKSDKYPARSVYKLEEVQKKHGLLRPGDTVLDLGCQPGSWSLYAARIVGPRGVVVGVDLQGGTPRNLTVMANVRRLHADITAPDFIDRLKENYQGFSVILSDIAPRTSGNKWVDQQQSLRLARRTLEIAGELLYQGGNYYCKVFQGEDFTAFVDEVRDRFKTVRIVKPKSSRSESRELFVLGLGAL